MDLAEIQTILENSTQNGTLTLSKDALDSPPIAELFIKYLLDGNLVIQQVSIIPVDDQNVTVAGQGASFPFENTFITAVFTAPHGIAAMNLQADGFANQTNKWNFFLAFPVLAKTFYTELEFSEGVLTLRSSNASVTQPGGLFFSGKQKITGTLGSIAKLLGKDKLPLGGPITLIGNPTPELIVPEMQLQDPDPASVFGMQFIYQLIDEHALTESRETHEQLMVPVPKMRLVSSITVATEQGPQVLAIVTQFTPLVDLLLFQANMDDVLVISQAALNALAQNINLGRLLPPQLPLVNYFRLGEWSMAVIPDVPLISTITIGVGIAESWTIIPKYFTLEDIYLNFSISFLSDKPETDAALTATVKILDGDAAFRMVVDAQYPSYVVRGFLDDGSEIDLVALVRYFLGDRIADSLPCSDLKVIVLNLLIDSRNSTFTFQTVIRSDCSFDLGIATFSLTEIDFNFSYVAAQVTGSFQARFWILPQATSQQLGDDPPAGAVAMQVSAAYNGAENGWSFRGGLQAGSQINLTDIVHAYLPEQFWVFVPTSVIINQLDAGFETGASQSYDFSIGAEWTIGVLNTTIGGLVTIRSFQDGNKRKDEGEIQGFLRFGGADDEGGLELKVKEKFDDATKQYEFEFLGWQARLSSEATGEKTLTFNAIGEKTLGEMIEVLINAVFPGADITLEAPWNVLNSIKLKDFQFIVKFSADSSPQTASLTYPLRINLGFVSIDGISLTYKVDTGEVIFKILGGQFLGQPINTNDPLEWDVAHPETTPAVPGQGSEVFRLDFLGMGQRMAVVNTETHALVPVPASITGAIAQLTAAFKEEDNLTLRFNEASDWLIATRFTVLQAVDLAAVFYDPYLYGLMVAVTGSKAGEKLPIFNGLVFEILYKKINDTVGMWQIDLTLPYYIRNLEFGAVSVTLPSMKLQVYTNGDFLVDFGFPANDDFSRSFSIQAFPFVGSGGVYFGKLSAATSNVTPQVTNGSFSPVITFGLGLRFGLGKDISYGPLKAGLSVTIQGVLEGVFAWYNSYPASLTAGSAGESQLARTGSRQLAAASSNSSFYYLIQARVSLVGKMYGTVDFKIVKATLDVEIRVSIRLALESYRAIDISFEARVSLTLKVRVNLGLFKVTIKLSFSMTLRFSTTIGSNSVPPWGQTALLRQTSFMRALDASSDEECPVIPVMKWQPILTVNPIHVPVMFVPQFTAGTDGPLNAGSPRKPYVVAMTYVDSTESSDYSSPLPPFEEIAQGALLWTLNAYLNSSKDNTRLEELLQQVITIDQLNEIFCYLTQPGMAEPFTEDEVFDFLKNYYHFQVDIAPEAGDNQDVSILPIMPLLKLTTDTGIDVDFMTQTIVSDDYLATVKAYFEELAVRYKSPSEKANSPSPQESTEPDEKSLASFIFLDFFAMLARSTIQDSISLLQTQEAELEANESLTTFTQRRTDLAIDVVSLALANAERPLRAGVQLEVTGVVYTIKRGDTLQSIAPKFNLDILELRRANPQIENGLKPASTLRLPAIKFTTSETNPESLLDISRLYGVSVAKLAHANQHVAELYPAGEPLLAPFAQQETVGKLVSLLGHDGKFNSLSGLAARVLLQGLRPPSPVDSPQAGATAPLYELTGQQIDASDLVNGSTITLSVPPEASNWFSLGKDGDSLTYTINSQAAGILQSLKTAPFGPIVKFEPAELLRIEPRRFTLPTSIIWHTPTLLATANQASATVEPTIWQFPSELMDVITGPQALQPQVQIWSQRQEAPGQEIPREPVKYYLWGTTIEIQVRQTASGDKVFLPNTYELTGIDSGGSMLLENLLVWYAGADAPTIVDIQILYPPNPAEAGQTEPPEGLQSDPDPTFFLLQTNLSTASQPPSVTAALASRLAAGSPERDPLGQTDIEFLKLMWESSVVNSGGYVLYYEAGPNVGLPGYLFSQDGVAKLTLLINYSIPDNVLHNYMNTVIIHQAVDTENEMLYISPKAQTVSNFQLSPVESLADVATRYRVKVSQLATQYNNAHALLAKGKHLRIPPSTYRVRTGDTLEAIAARANVTPQSIATLNAGVNVNDLSAVRFLRIPETIWRVEAGDSFASLAERFSITVVTLAHANKNVAGLVAGTLEFDDRLEQAIATIPAGNVAFHFRRGPISNNTPESQLDELYNLLGYRIKEGNGFEATNSALPISPVTPEESTEWIYDSVVPVFPFVTPLPDPTEGIPDPRQDPYNGVGSTVELNFNWQDLFGNWIDSDYQAPSWPNQAFPIGYIDDLMPLDQWPSVNTDYLIARGDDGSPELSVTLRFNADLYLSDDDDSDAGQEMALTDLGKFRTIYYQLSQPDVSVTMSSTMQPEISSAASESSPKDVMIEFVLEIINYLTLVSEGSSPSQLPNEMAFSQPVADENSLNLFALVVRVQISRNPDLVADEFKDIPSVSQVSSRVPANAGDASQTALEAEPAPPLSLQEFAVQLEDAFPSLKVLVAAPKKSLGEAAEEIWLARFSNTPTGIAFTIDGQSPSFYAVPPLARNLLSRPDVLVYPYIPGKFIGDQTPIKTSQNSVDLDQMGRDFLTAMEEVLGPQFSAQTWKLEYGSGAKSNPANPPDPLKTPYEAIVAAKELLATAISNHAVNVFETSDPPEGLADAREQLRQQLLVKLTSAISVDVVMQYPVAVTQSEYAADDPFAPRLFGKPVTENPEDPSAVEKKNAFSFSTGAFSLAKRPTGTRLTFSFDTNREQQGKEGEQFDDVFTIDLYHQINALEHEIHPVDGIAGYLASSWLTFVLPGEPPTLVPLGQQTIPVPLRAYPTPPSLSEQTFIPLVKQFVGDGSEAEANGEELLVQARAWRYVCQYEYVGAAHDKILASIKLNVPATEVLQAKFSDADNPDLFAALVQFTAAYPGIAKDLDEYLATGTNPQFAYMAIASFAWLAQRTANAWATWQSDSVLHKSAPPESPEYHFVITQRAELVHDVSALVVTVTAAGALRLQELPKVEIAGYKTESLEAPAGSASYYFVSEDDAQILTYEDGRNLSTRGLAFSYFDVLKVENAWAGAAVKRNEDLLPNQTTNPDFVLQSPVVRFVNVLTPLLDPDVEIDIADFTTQRPASLAQFLSNFLIAFFEGAQTIGDENRTVRLNASYGYGVSSSMPDLNITLPILLTTPTSISILPQNLGPNSPFVSSIASTITAWVTQNDPSGFDLTGRLWFDLSIYSSLSESQLPVLRMRRLFLETHLLARP